MLAEDETHLNLLAWVRATWVARGTRQRVMTPGTNRWRTIFGAVDLCTVRFCYQVTRKAVSANFTAFCEPLLAAYPAAPLVAVICHNVIIHHSKPVQRWLASHPRPSPCLLPPAQPGPAAGHCRAPQPTLAPRR